MEYYNTGIGIAVSNLGSDLKKGLSTENLIKNQKIYGRNVISKKKKDCFIKRFFSILSEPMLIILTFGFILTFGINLGKLFKGAETDFTESFGILSAVLLSVFITLFMEGSSTKAFNALNKIYDNLTVKVIRDGEVVVVNREFVCVGDVVIIESGDKIIADGRLIYSRDLKVDESTLTGESIAVKKDANAIVDKNSNLSERINSVYSGTFVTGGEGKMLVTAIGDNTEIGKIANELKSKKDLPSPLNQKMAKLGKTVTIIGVISSIIVFICSFVRLVLTKNVNFSEVQNLFVSSVILIVAAVPEGLPTIVAVSLALNMIKLAKENALIKKMTATETSGAVSVICSDKTGTLTENKMSVISFHGNGYTVKGDRIKEQVLYQNFIINSTADLIKSNGEFIYKGSGTECALISSYVKSSGNLNYYEYRKKYKVTERVPFSSEKKIMSTSIIFEGKTRRLIKGAPEKIISSCSLPEGKKNKLLLDIEKEQKLARRVLCFAHDDGNGMIFDGYAVIADGIRKDVKSAVRDCRSAGVKIKILTGDNGATAYAIAKELDIVKSEKEVVNCSEIENLSMEDLKKILPKITVIARSTPIMKLKVVKALKELGEVVAVTGDGINDAPAIRHADVGIAMGKSGSEICKEASDVVLIDDSFATVVKAIAFGRNVFKNLQRFIIFQLSVNISALLFITVSAIMGRPTPFNTLQLLWINVIMDGPPAITLGLYKDGTDLMRQKPVKRGKNILSRAMLIRILFNGIFVATIMCLQYFFNVLKVSENEKSGATFTLFIIFQLFNAFNSRELGLDGVLKNLNKNRIMAVTFLITFILQIIIVQCFYSLFGITPLTIVTWLKLLLIGSTIVFVTEGYKLAYKLITKSNRIGVNVNKNPKVA